MDTCSTGVGLDTLPTLTDAAGSNASGSMAVDTPPPTQPPCTQQSPRGDPKSHAMDDGDVTDATEDDETSAVVDECVEQVKRRRQSDGSVHGCREVEDSCQNWCCPFVMAAHSY